MTKLMEKVSFGILLMAAFIICLCTYWLVWPYSPMTIKEVRAVNSPVYPGTELEVYIDSFKNLPLPARVLGAIENDHSYPFSELYTNVPVGPSDWILRIKIPESIPAGEYRFHRTYIYRVNPLREVTVEWSVPFLVRGSDNDRR